MQLSPQPDNYKNYFRERNSELEIAKKVVAKLSKNQLNNVNETNSYTEKLKSRNVNKELKNINNLNTLVQNFFPTLIQYNFDQITKVYNDIKIELNWKKVVNNIRLYPELGINYFSAKNRFDKAKNTMIRKVPYLGKGVPRGRRGKPQAAPYLGKGVPRGIPRR
jgi:hypothetical protein